MLVFNKRMYQKCGLKCPLCSADSRAPTVCIVIILPIKQHNGVDGWKNVSINKIILWESTLLILQSKILLYEVSVLIFPLLECSNAFLFPPSWLMAQLSVAIRRKIPDPYVENFCSPLHRLSLIHQPRRDMLQVGAGCWSTAGSTINVSYAPFSSILAVVWLNLIQLLQQQRHRHRRTPS